MEQYKHETEITDMDGFVTMAAFTGAKKEQAAVETTQGTSEPIPGGDVWTST